MAKTANTKPEFSMFPPMNGMSTDMFRENMERFMSLTGDMGEISRKNMTTASECARATAKGAQDINKRAMTYFQGAMANSIEASRTIASAKSVQEAVELQANFAKTAMETYLEEMNAIAGIMANTMREVFEPINAQAGEMIEKYQSAN